MVIALVCTGGFEAAKQGAWDWISVRWWKARVKNFQTTVLTFLPCHQLSDILVFQNGGRWGRRKEKKEQTKYAWHLDPGYNEANALWAAQCPSQAVCKVSYIWALIARAAVLRAVHFSDRNEQLWNFLDLQPRSGAGRWALHGWVWWKKRSKLC